MTAKRAKRRARHGALQSRTLLNTILDVCHHAWPLQRILVAPAGAGGARPQRLGQACNAASPLLGRVRFDSRVALTNLASVR